MRHIREAKGEPSELGRRGRTLLQWRRQGQRRQHKSSGGDEDVGEAGQIIIMSLLLLLLKRQKAFAVTIQGILEGKR